MRILIAIIVVCLTGVALAQVPANIPHAPWHYGGATIAPVLTQNPLPIGMP